MTSGMRGLAIAASDIIVAGSSSRSSVLTILSRIVRKTSQPETVENETLLRDKVGIWVIGKGRVQWRMHANYCSCVSARFHQRHGYNSVLNTGRVAAQ